MFGVIFIFLQSYLASNHGSFFANLLLCIFLLIGLILTGSYNGEKIFLEKFNYFLFFEKALIKKDYKRNKVCETINDRKK